MRAKGVVVGIKGTVLMIDLKPQWREKRVFVKEGEVVVEKKETDFLYVLPSSPQKLMETLPGTLPVFFTLT